MQIQSSNPKCWSGLPVVPSVAPRSIRCGRCSREIALDVSDLVRADRAVDRCPVCSGADFYVRKDFDPKVGLAVVIVAALVSAGCYWFGLDLVAYGIRGGAVVSESALSGQSKQLTVCP